ncbi:MULTISPECIES: branched-chain amino acid ABC transporter substrate-binding protein [unclassified Crossiella]|uniref:branched-chain amino acid ABC transporter substrate-binding protein n=1 Tax=unclassified Crossiella TaxID=2620835 RepID=UPI001FFE2F26|nr:MULTISPECIES: branched-chain amino acid ABC transporter substrate-binding protein [unclassified Crossiella]MCK2239718.1 branched-chain amino acid ABC transporter substrate-binding protein [Crossiella sp. S99.2]MCK2252413.1 branched-chain amino acid ABC transporter substrate-binding protein [Crossiella sp. S99.1]
MSGARLVRTLAVASVIALTVAGCGGGSGSSGNGGQTSGGQAAPGKPGDAADPRGDGNAKCSNVSLAYIGTINGGNAALGQAILNGAQLAINQHNSANAGCQVNLKKYDSEGSPDKAPGVVTQAITDTTIVGVIGMPFSGESKAVGGTFNEAGLVTITPSATNPGLTKNGWKTFFRGLGNDAVQGPAAAKFLTEELKAQKVCVIRDDSEYGTGLADAIKGALGSKVTCEDQIKTNQREFSATASKLKSANVDAIFFAGYYAEGGPLASKLFDEGIKAKFVAPDGTKDDEFIKGGADGAEGAYLTCPCVPADAFTEFSTAYKQLSGKEPSTYSAEGYDAATILLKGIDKGLKDRAGLLDFVKNYEGQGLTKKFKWDATGELTDTPVWSYKVEGGKIVKFKPITK